MSKPPAKKKVRMEEAEAGLETAPSVSFPGGDGASSAGGSNSRPTSSTCSGASSTSSTSSTSTVSAAIPFDRSLGLADLNGLPIDTLFSYLDARSLFRVACLTSKYLHECVTLKHVVWSAVSSGGNARESLDRVVKLVKKRKIYTPSKFRLLRLMNGHRCERGKDCVRYGYALAAGAEAKAGDETAASSGSTGGATSGNKRKRQQPNKVNKGVALARKDFGLFVCGDCTECWRTKRLPKEDSDSTTTTQQLHSYATQKIRRSRNGWFLRHKRLSTRDQNSSFSPIVWGKPFTDSAGENAGPVLTYADYLDAKGSEDIIKKRLKEVDKEDREARSTAKDIIAYHKAAVEVFETRKRDKVNETEEKRLKVYNKRVEQFKELIAMLQKRLEGSAWREIALAYDIRPAGRSYIRTESVAAFKCPIVQDIMKEYTVCPNKASKDRDEFNRIANDITYDFNLIWTCGFHDFSFLDIKALEGDQLSADLRDYYRGRVTPTVLMHHGRMHAEVMDLIRSGQCLEALYRRFQSMDSIHMAESQYDNNASNNNNKKDKDGNTDPVWFTLAWSKFDVTENSIKDFFLHAVMSREERSLGHVSHENARRIAQDLRQNKLWGDKWSKVTGEGFVDAWTKFHSECTRKFQAQMAVAHQYCDDIMSGNYGEQPGESEARRARRKQILCEAVRCTYLLTGRGNFERLRNSVRWELNRIDID